MEKDFYITLMYKELVGENSPEESQLLNNFLKESSENEELYADVRLSWELSDQTLNLNQLDVEADLKSVKSRMSEPKMGAKIVPFRRRFLQVAAAILIFAIAGFLVRNLSMPTAIELFAENGNLDFELPDGSKGTLRQGSRLIYESSFTDNRTSTLLGTATFSVTHDESHPFSVKVQDAVVKVLGTEFTIAQTEETEPLIVSVQSGKVSLTQKNESIILTKGEVGICASQISTPQKVDVTGNNFLYWEKQQFRFDGEELRSVNKQIEMAFHVKIDISNRSMNTCRLSGIFNEIKLEELLYLIAGIFEMELVKISEKSFRLDEGTCE